MGKGLLEGSWKVRGNRRGGDNISGSEVGAPPGAGAAAGAHPGPGVHSQKFRVGTNPLQGLNEGALAEACPPSPKVLILN